MHKPTLTNPIFLLASVSAGDDDAYKFEELSTDGIFVLDLGTLREPENVWVSHLCPQNLMEQVLLQFVTDFQSNLVVIPRASGEHVPFVCKLPSERISVYSFADDRGYSGKLIDCCRPTISQECEVLMPLPSPHPF